MTIQKEAISLENFQRAEKGLPPQVRPKVIRPEPEKPEVADEIAFKDIPEDLIFEFNARGCTFKNKDGVRFTGFNIYLETRNGTVIEAWMPEGEFQLLRQRIRVEAPELLQKIGL